MVGPCRQLKNMFHKKRVITTIVYLTFLILTLVVAFAVRCCAATPCFPHSAINTC